MEFVSLTHANPHRKSAPRCHQLKDRNRLYPRSDFKSLSACS